MLPAPVSSAYSMACKASIRGRRRNVEGRRPPWRLPDGHVKVSTRATLSKCLPKRVTRNGN